jgi:hypothetical protein
MVPPSVVIKDGMGRQRFARSFSWSAATERLVNAILVVINSELFQLSPQVECVPDQHVIKNRRIVPISRSTNGWDNLLCDAGTANTGIAAFELDDRVNEFLLRPFWAGTPMTSRREKPPIFAFS